MPVDLRTLIRISATKIVEMRFEKSIKAFNEQSISKFIKKSVVGILIFVATYGYPCNFIVDDIADITVHMFIEETFITPVPHFLCIVSAL